MYKPNMEDKRLKIKIKNKTNVALHGLKPGGELTIDADKKSTPLVRHWRRRLRDDSIEIIKEEVKKKTKPKEDKK